MIVEEIGFEEVKSMVRKAPRKLDFAITVWGADISFKVDECNE